MTVFVVFSVFFTSFSRFWSYRQIALCDRNWFIIIITSAHTGCETAAQIGGLVSVLFFTSLDSFQGRSGIDR